MWSHVDVKADHAGRIRHVRLSNFETLDIADGMMAG